MGSQDILDTGQVAFGSVEAHIPITDPVLRRRWFEQPGGPRLVASEGDTAPIPPGDLVIDNLIFALSNEAGQTMMTTTLAGPSVDGSNRQAIFVEESGVLELVARQGDPLPSLPDDVVFTTSTPTAVAFNAAGEVLLGGGLTGPGIDASNNSATYVWEAGTLRLLFQRGQPISGLPGGVNAVRASLVLPGAGSFGPAMNDAGEVVLNMVLDEQFTTSVGSLENRTAIYVEQDGAYRLVADQGDPALGLPAGVEFEFVDAFGIGAGGEVAFATSLVGPGVVPPGPFGGGGNNVALYVDSGGNPSLVARLGDQAPGTDPGVEFFSFSRRTIGDGGDVAFLAGLTGPGVVSENGLGLWIGDGSNTELVARTGSQAPGLPAGMVFQQFDMGLVNARGQVSLIGLAGDDSAIPGMRGIWATDPAGVLQLIVKAGDELEVAPGVFRTVEFLNIGETSPDAEGTPTGFNALGQLAFQATFTDGSTGIFVTDRVAIPEPSSVMLLLLAVATSWLRRR